MSQQPTQGSSQAARPKAARPASRSPPDSTRSQSHVGPKATAAVSNSGSTGPWAAYISEAALESAKSKGYLPLDHPAYGDGVVNEDDLPEGYKVVYDCQGCHVDVERHIELWIHQLGCLGRPESFMSIDSQRPWLVPNNYVFVKESPVAPVDDKTAAFRGWSIRHVCGACIRSAKYGVIRWQAMGFRDQTRLDKHTVKCPRTRNILKRYVATEHETAKVQEKYEPPPHIKQQLQQLPTQASSKLTQDWVDDVIKPILDLDFRLENFKTHYRCSHTVDLNFWPNTSHIKSLGETNKCGVWTVSEKPTWDLPVNWVFLKKETPVTRKAKVDPTKALNI